ncbi:amidase [Poseidonocella sp. HB161398]|uniref:amidase n=1 Tax=Poseidonocella sp. HB161398 TaxID=2320855 RepID=UPI001487384B|nr:amidase [Poseidonocella sp. HB161398]
MTPETLPDGPWDLVAHVAAVREGALDPVAEIDRRMARIAAAGPAINAIRTPTADTARVQAAAGAGSALAGAALGHKDMFDRPERRMTCGARIREAHVPTGLATALARLDAAGGADLATLSMSEFAQAPTGHNGHFGAVRNPHDAERVSGGSSSGSAAAVAAGFVLGSLGSDTGGSIRIPAACCGVTGLKPTWSRVSAAGAMPLAPSFDCIGPIARSARDCALLLRLIAGADPRDGDCSSRPVPDYGTALDGDLRGQRIGLPEGPFLQDLPGAIRARFDAALEVLTARGAKLHRVTIPHLDRITACAGIASRVEVAGQHLGWMQNRPGDYAPMVSARMYPGYAIPGALYIEAMRQRPGLMRQVLEDTFGAVDMLALPTLKDTPPTIAESDIETGGEGAVARFLSLSANTRTVSFLGLPAISVPMGPCAQGMPTGLQLVGRPFAEARLLRAADALQRDTAWHRRLPVIPHVPVHP